VHLLDHLFAVEKAKAQALVPLSPELAAVHRELGIPPNYASSRGLAPHVEAGENELVEVALNNDGRPIRLLKSPADAWQRMQRAAAEDGIALIAISGFRSVARQAEIIREKRGAGQSIDDILRYIAAPGFSEHHTGRAIDIGSPEHVTLEEEFGDTPAFRWLEQHAGQFGFLLSYPRDNSHGIGYEPWHWCWQATP
jgi:zinc D-Ala-D-Ala carboxypeptidase